MKNLISAAVLATGLLVSSGAWAEDTHSGNAFLKACTDKKHGEQMLCIGYIVGISQGLVNTQTFADKDKFSPICIPEKKVSMGQRKDIFIKYMKEHPEKRHWVGMSLFIMAMREAFPCPK